MKNHQLKGRGRSGVQDSNHEARATPTEASDYPKLRDAGNVGLDFLHLAILELNRRRTAKNRDRNLEP